MPSDNRNNGYYSLSRGGAHLYLINEFNANRHKPITKWLEYQRTKNLKVLEENEDVRKQQTTHIKDEYANKTKTETKDISSID